MQEFVPKFEDIAPVPEDLPASSYSWLNLLWQAALEAEGLSGRALRKLPLQAHAFFIQRPSCSARDFANALLNAARKEKRNRSEMREGAEL